MAEFAIARESPLTPEARKVIAALDRDLNDLYPSENNYNLNPQELSKEGIYFFLVRKDREGVGCGVLKLLASGYGEIKSLYVRPSDRGCGMGSLILTHLLRLALDLKIHTLQLETGIYQPEAIALYEKFGFYSIPCFNGYEPHSLSLFYEKKLEDWKGGE